MYYFPPVLAGRVLYQAPPVREVGAPFSAYSEQSVLPKKNQEKHAYKIKFM